MESYRFSDFVINFIVVFVLTIIIFLFKDRMSLITSTIFLLSLFIIAISALSILFLQNDKKRIGFEVELYSTLLSGIMIGIFVDIILNRRINYEIVYLLLGLIIVYSVILFKKYKYQD